MYGRSGSRTMAQSELRPLWTSENAEAAVKPLASDGTWSAWGVSTDTRLLRPGDLFIALKGPRYDGNDFVLQALKGGAAAVCFDRYPDDFPSAAPFLMVRDSFQALRDLAAYRRAQSDARIIAVTGSSGKTSTTQTLFHLLRQFHPTHATQENLNNHYGVPLSLARMPEESQSAVFELGMSSGGEIADLSRLVLPHTAIITSIAPSHLEFFDSLQGIARAKAEIFSAMTKDGVAIIHRDTPFFPFLESQARRASLETVLTFGADPRSDACLLSCVIDSSIQRTLVTARLFDVILTYEIGCLGKYHAMNSLAALLAIHVIGGNLSRAAQTLGSYHPLAGRGTFHTFPLEQGGTFRVIDETYNANPFSMAASIEMLGMIDGEGRRLVCLGPMHELGEKSERFHSDLLDPLEQAKIDRVFCCGLPMKPLYDALDSQKQGAFAVDSAALAPLIWDRLQPDDILLIKGSRAARMETAIQFFMTRSRP